MTQGMGVWFSENTLPPHSVVHTSDPGRIHLKKSQQHPERLRRLATDGHPGTHIGRRPTRAEAVGHDDPVAGQDNPASSGGARRPGPTPAGHASRRVTVNHTQVVPCHPRYGCMVSLLRDPCHARYGGMVFSRPGCSQVGTLAAERNPAPTTTRQEARLCPCRD